MSQGGSALGEPASPEPAGAEACPQLLAAGTQGTWPSRWWPGWQPGAGAGLPAPRARAGAANAPAVWLAPRVYPALGGGALGRGAGARETGPQKQVPQALKAGPGLQCGLRPLRGTLGDPAGSRPRVFALSLLPGAASPGELTPSPGFGALVTL